MIDSLKVQQRKLLILGIITIFVLYIVPIFIRPDHFFEDDSFFYTQVAYHIVNGHGSTFNQITDTNGYHPLWMILCIFGMLAAGGNKALAMSIIVAMEILLTVGICWFFVKIARLLDVIHVAIVALPIICIYFLNGIGIYGTEAHINGFTLIAAFYFFLQALLFEGARRWALAGVFFGLAILARLDNVFVVGAFILAGVILRKISQPAQLVKDFVAVTAPILILFVPYIIYNMIEFGHAVPISGAIKSAFPRIAMNVDLLGSTGKTTLLFAVLSLLIAARLEDNPLRRLFLFSLGGGVVLHALYVVLFGSHAMEWPWYYVSGMLNVCFILPVAAGLVLKALEQPNVRSLVRNASIAIILLTILAGIPRAWARVFTPTPRTLNILELSGTTEQRWQKDLVSWMNTHVPPRSKILVADWPGALAYYSDFSILPVDGLISNYAYNDEILASGINQYLAQHGVKYYFGMKRQSSAGVQEETIYAPLYRRPAGKLMLRDSNIQVVLSELLPYASLPPLTLWALE